MTQLISYPDLPRSGGGEISHFDIPEPTTEIGVRDYDTMASYHVDYFFYSYYLFTSIFSKFMVSVA